MRGRLVASAVGIVVVLLLAEGLSRVLGYVPARPSAAYVALVRRVGPLPRPRSRVLSESAGEFRHWISSTDLGFRGPRAQFEPGGGRRPRILALGDSYTAAWQVALEERFTERLERLQPRWSVLNLGRPNWGTDREYLLLLSYPFAAPADVILLVMTPLNDIADNGLALLRGAPERPHFVPADPGSGGTGRLREVSWPYREPFEESDEGRFALRVRGWLRLHSVSYGGARDLWQTLTGWLSDARRSSREPLDGTKGPPWEAGVFAIEDADPRWKLAWQVTDSLLGLARAAARERGAELRIVLIPHYAAVHPALRPTYADPRRFDLARVSRSLSATARAHDIPVLDLTPAFVEFHRHDPRRRPLFRARDKHFTPPSATA